MRGAAEALGGTDFGGELLLLFAQGSKITLDLQPVPELRRLAEKGPEADGHDRSDGSVPQDDLVDRAGCYADGAGRGVLGNPHRIEVFLEQDFAGCYVASSLVAFGFHAARIRSPLIFTNGR